MAIRNTFLGILSALMSVWSAQRTGADTGNVDMSTVPPRDSVQLTIYNSEDLTLVSERRHVTFKKGVSALQFSWANTLIDPTSVQLQFRTAQEHLELLDTTFPHDKPQMLYWNVRSEADTDAEVEISYFTSGITWQADYVCVSNQGESAMTFDGFVRIINNSGEDYESAAIRLVVGSINMVEKVADLARRGLVSRDELQRAQGAAHYRVADAAPAAKSALLAEMRADIALGGRFEVKEIIKQGLSEYFIFTVPGTETVKHTWTKRMRLFEGTNVPCRVEYRWRPAEYGEQLVRMLLLRNDTASTLGSTPLPDGAVRVFRDNGRDGLSFVALQNTRYVPIGQEIELNLGIDPLVVLEVKREKSWRDNFWFARGNDQRLVSPDKGDRVDPSFSMAGWDDHDRVAHRIRNYREQPISVEFRLRFEGDVAFRSALSPTLYDFQSPVVKAVVAAGGVTDLRYELKRGQGVNAKQNKVVLENANGLRE